MDFKLPKKGRTFAIVISAIVLTFAIIIFFFFQHNSRNIVKENNVINTEKRGFFQKDYDKTTPVYRLSPVEAGKILSNGQCDGEGVPHKLGSSPMDPEDFAIVIPYGLLAGGHVTPIDHQYFSPKDYNSPLDAYEVYAMADATIVTIEPRERNDRGEMFEEYRIVFSVTCTYFYYYDLVTSLSPDIKKEYEEARTGFMKRPLSIKVKEGQLIGRIGGQTLDFAVWDTTKKLSGFVVPEHYNSEPWKIFTVDPLDYYSSELRQFILSRYVRTSNPKSGKIDYDIDGRLIGNWFLEGTEDYSGGKESTNWDYWKGHLSIVPDHIDPRGVFVSFGDFNGEATQFFVHNLNIRPEDVNISTGIVRYELGDYSYIKENGEYWDRNSVAKNLTIIPTIHTNKHCVLLQLLEDRKLGMEYFTNTACTDNLQFTDNAVFYYR